MKSSKQISVIINTIVSHSLILLLVIACSNPVDKSSTSATFSDDYISEHRGKYFIEIPEVYELAHVIMAIEYQNSRNDYFIQKNTSYFKEVLEYFDHYTTSKIFTSFNFTETDFSNNYSFRTNSYAYTFNNDKLISKGIYPAMWSHDEFSGLKEDVEEFYLESDFKSFYNDHLDYYNSQIQFYDSLVPINDIWQWLESQFSSRYDCYKIIFSPLTTGSHNVTGCGAGNYKEILIFVTFDSRDIVSWDSIDTILNIRYSFTEIDHRYVNPVSDKYLSEINKTLSDLSKWKDSNNINTLYDNSYMVFNEYMTWAVFDLYVFEKYSEKIFTDIKKITINKMEKSRGFINFGKFDDFLLELYQNRSENQTIEDLYPNILKWLEMNN